MTPLSMSPARVPIIRPSLGVSPIEVSMLFPLRIAAIEAPLPIWAVTILDCERSRPAISAPFSLT